MDIGPVRRHSLIAFMSSIGVTAIGFFATIYIAHNAGATALGGFFLLLAYVGIIGLFTDGGISGAALQRISEGESQWEYFSAHAAVRCILLAATLTVLLAIRPVFVDLNQSGLFLWLLFSTRCVNSGWHHIDRCLWEWEGRNASDCRPVE